MPYPPDTVVVDMKWENSCANTLNSLKHNTHFITVFYSLADSFCHTSFVKFYKTPCVLLETSDHLSYLSEMCQRGHLCWLVSHHPLYRFQVWALPSHPSLTSCEWGFSVSNWREALVCISRSRTALDCVWMGDSRGVLNCGDVCSSHPRKVLYCVCSCHSKDTLACACPGPHCWWTQVCLVTFSKKLCPSVSDTAVATRGQQL